MSNHLLLSVLNRSRHAKLPLCTHPPPSLTELGTSQMGMLVQGTVSATV